MTYLKHLRRTAVLARVIRSKNEGPELINSMIVRLPVMCSELNYIKKVTCFIKTSCIIHYSLVLLSNLLS